ncbi:C-type lectin domain family 2 member A isoform X2 [Camelus ferus]|nr:C-type lectin domain family 2 member A isoform X2 [Camelus ferus]XP_032329404.1 C-type lectin domain family 2 member A isoform X2 [Camelus ferus]XP_032329405.1 C-type lectin domain family 2 member A isoform X2 [Camelus ferus]XP_045366176.1 C-type lectin domain family 2 member A isoform X2 [Camelus bactrianus]XP_045366177.1 C-type lectin domain family 2 member A isoform X2 [Camelus bactrianus]
MHWRADCRTAHSSSTSMEEPVQNVYLQSLCPQDEPQLPLVSPGHTPRPAVCKLICCVCALSITVVILLTVLFTKFSKYPQAMECPEKWIGAKDKCFYFSEETRNWTASKRFCSSQRSELAQIDTPEDMKFLKMCTGTSMHWIGLSRALGESWRWTNGTTFNAWFEISGNGLFALLNTDGVSSSRGFIDIKWICSKSRFLMKEKKTGK